MKRNSAYIKKQRREKVDEVVFTAVGLLIFCLTIASGYLLLWLVR